MGGWSPACGASRVNFDFLLKLFVTYYTMECPQKVQTTMPFTQREFQLKRLGRHIGY